MTIPTQTRVGAYKVIAPLGHGGMGEVYRAEDTKLGRDVAIKVLSDGFTSDPERVARFEREAKVLASLNHPNIAAIYGLERFEDASFIVMELVEGETLRRRIESSHVDLQNSLKIFYQIAQALESAHEKGIIHRDLKPENVMVSSDGLVKVLDFGLAKALKAEQPAKPPDSPTATFTGTVPGVIMGTAPYMSPEQARGQTMDKRTDIWSFGCCLYEVLSGRQPFAADSLSDVLAGIVGREPVWSALPGDLPPALSNIVRRCLEKDVRDRLHDIADVRIELGELLAVRSHPSLAATRGEVTTSRRRSGRYLAGLLGLVAGGLMTYFLTASRGAPPESQPVLRLSLELPATAPLALGSGPSLAMSPSGRRIVYVASRGDTTQLHARNLDHLTPQPIPDSEDGVGPFLSPDGEWIGFFAEGKLKKISLSGGLARTLIDSPTHRGASWGDDDSIVFAPQSAAGLSWVSGSGAGLRSLTELDSAADERSHRWPQRLPGDDGVLVTVWSGSRFDIEVLSVESGARTKLIENGSYARYTPSGHLVFVRGSDLMAAPFDLRHRAVTGPVVRVLENIGVDPLSGAGFFAFDRDGLLVFAPVGRVSDPSVQGGNLILFDREGGPTLLAHTERSLQLPRLSPDGQRLLMTIEDEDDETSDLWARDLQRGTMTRLTFQGSSAAGIWTADGERVVFSSDREGRFNLFWKAADGTGDVTRLTSSENPQMPTSWSPDGRSLIFGELDPTTGFDVWILPMGPTGPSQSPEPFLQTPFNEIGGTFSPDGDLIAYVSDESGQNEVYARKYPEGGKWPLSVGGGTEPVWAHRGGELFYRNGEWMMSVSVGVTPEFSAGQPNLMFETPYSEGEAAYPNFDVTEDGRVIMFQTGAESTTRLDVIVHWFEELERLAPTK